jgi:phenylalanyl-tRNA synthetase beta chain
MRVLLSWLREFCPTGLSADDLAELLTSRAAKVEAIHRPWDGLGGVVVAQVVEVRDHPNSAKLCVARVRTNGEERQLVVGVRNMRAGDLVPLAAPGARVPVLAEPLTVRKVRDVASEGMLCSPRELGVSPDHQGILILPPGTPIGADVRSTFGLDDVVLDIEVTPNRPDLLSVAGVAREAAAATGTPFVPPDTDVPEDDSEKAGALATVEIQDLERCPRYLARVIRGVRAGPSPIRVQARLTASGMRPLTNIVDATNYVMLEMGQPQHPFDLGLLGGQGIVVRRAEDGERLVTLDEVERVLTPEDLVIADRDKGVAIAGVMGSAAAEVSSRTEDVLLESAHFDRLTVARTSRRLGLRTEASVRFERGSDPEAVPPAAARAARFIAEWSGGRVAAGAVEAGGPPARRHVSIRAGRASLIAGHQLSAADVGASFDRMGISTATRNDRVDVEVPGYRPDLESEIDLVEEVVRVRGYDRIGSTLPGVRQPGGVPARYALRRRVRDAMVAAGLREAWSFSFAAWEDLRLMGHQEAIRISNPLAAEQAFLRRSLLPGLLHAVRHNVARQVDTVALFEIGHVFLPADPVQEVERVAAVLTGRTGTGHPGGVWTIDVFDAKGVLEVLAGALGIRGWTLVADEVAPPFHPVRSAAVEIDGRPAGALGELHPRVASDLELPHRVALLDLDVDALAEAIPLRAEFRDLPRFPPIRRDLAFVVDEATPAGAVREAVLEGAGALADAVILFDVFTGDPIPAGRKSLAFSVELRARDRTLTDEEAERAVRRIADEVRGRLGGELRAG